MVVGHANSSQVYMQTIVYATTVATTMCTQHTHLQNSMTGVCVWPVWCSSLQTTTAAISSAEVEISHCLFHPQEVACPDKRTGNI